MPTGFGRATYREVTHEGQLGISPAPRRHGRQLSGVVTLLVPQSPAVPAMLLVVTKGTLAPDGTISNEVVRTYLPCRPRGAARAF
jgi:hypothetical protein